MNRTTIPFSRSNWTSFSPNQNKNTDILNKWTYNNKQMSLSTQNYHFCRVKKVISSQPFRQLYYDVTESPWGIQVILTESRRFLLLKAVLIPITTNAFFLGAPFWGKKDVAAEPSEIPISRELRVADNSLLSIEICLSRDLTSLQKKNPTKASKLLTK